MPMPYTLAKGTILAVLEDLANPSTPAEHARLASDLQRLRAGDPVTSISTAGLPNQPGLAPLVERLARNWFGQTPDGAGGWLPQQPFSPTNTRTGYFKRYYGNVEAILRETLIRTIEVSFGIDHGAALATSTRQWPVEILWKCPNPWFEGWVTWRRHDTTPAGGQVTVLLASPAEDANPVVNVAALPPGVATPLPDPTVVSPDDHGMWLVTHEEHVKHNVDALTELPEDSYLDNLIDGVRGLFGLKPGQWSIPLPSTTWEGIGVIDVVHVPESAGGAAPFGATPTI